MMKKEKRIASREINDLTSKRFTDLRVRGIFFQIQAEKIHDSIRRVSLDRAPKVLLRSHGAKRNVGHRQPSRRTSSNLRKRDELSVQISVFALLTAGIKHEFGRFHQFHINQFRI